MMLAGVLLGETRDEDLADSAMQRLDDLAPAAEVGADEATRAQKRDDPIERLVVAGRGARDPDGEGARADGYQFEQETGVGGQERGPPFHDRLQADLARGGSRPGLRGLARQLLDEQWAPGRLARDRLGCSPRVLVVGSQEGEGERARVFVLQRT